MNNSKINKRNMIIMGLIGMFLSIILSVGIAVAYVGYGKSSNVWLMYLTGVVLTIGFGFWGSKMKKEEVVDEKSLNQERLSSKEKMYIWFFSFINPVITGGVTYYMYKDIYPMKAKQANIISFVTFIPWALFILSKYR